MCILSSSFRDARQPSSLYDYAANTPPHNPVRFANTTGIVVQLVRPEGSIGEYALR